MPAARSATRQSRALHLAATGGLALPSNALQHGAHRCMLARIGGAGGAVTAAMLARSMRTVATLTDAARSVR